MFTYHFLKKKKNKVKWICGNGIAKIGGKKKIPTYFAYSHIGTIITVTKYFSFLLSP